MLETQFFPTPPDVIRRMLDPYVLERDRYTGSQKYLKNASRILEPSAGNGAILDLMIKEYNVAEEYSNDRIFSCEIQPDLRAILAEKGYTVLEADFLEYREPINFNLIVMNPPFDQGVKHVLHAWEFLNGELVALVNAETIHNPYTKERKVLKHLIEAHGTVDYWGQCFKNAERPTDVEVACIRLSRHQEEEAFDFENQGSWEFTRGIRDEEFNPDTLTRPDVIRDLVARYQAAERLIIERREMQRKLDFVLQGVKCPVMDSVKRETGESLRNETSLEDMISALKSRFWNTFFIKTKISSKLTSNFQKKFREFSQQKASLAFSEANVKEVVGLFMINHEQLMLDCLLEVFDTATKYHEKNKVHVEGWKTNKGWKINSRIIMPYGICYDKDLGYFSSNYYRDDFFSDIDKALSWVWGVDPSRVKGTSAAIEQFCRDCRDGVNYKQGCESTFFKIKIFKKGTVHLDFKDQALLDEFNHRAAKGRGWLPGEGY